MCSFFCLKFPSPVPTGILVPGSLLSVDIEACAVFPLRSPNAYLTLRNLGYPDAAVSGPHHFDGDPTSDIAACPGVVF